MGSKAKSFRKGANKARLLLHVIGLQGGLLHASVIPLKPRMKRRTERSSDYHSWSIKESSDACQDSYAIFTEAWPQ